MSNSLVNPFIQALSYLKANGWIKGSYTAHNDEHSITVCRRNGHTPSACVGGALLMLGYRLYGEEFIFLSRHVENTEGTRLGLSLYNDSSHQTLAAIEEMLIRAAQRWEQRHAYGGLDS